MLKKLIQLLKKELTNNHEESCRKDCKNCKYMELIPFDDYRCMNVKSELFHCEVTPNEDVCIYYTEREKE